MAGTRRLVLAPEERGQQLAGNRSGLARQVEQQRDLAASAGQLLQRPCFGLGGTAPLGDLEREAAEGAYTGAWRAVGPTAGPLLISDERDRMNVVPAVSATKDINDHGPDLLMSA